MTRPEIAVVYKGIRYVYLLGSRPGRAFGVGLSGLLLLLGFVGCTI
jgi:hypothetical protein